jgi:hypothetical protein
MIDRTMGGGRTQAQTLAMLIAVTFVLVGVLGFIPGITTHYGDLSFAGDDSGAKLLGIFQVSILHNLVQRGRLDSREQRRQLAASRARGGSAWAGFCVDAREGDR